MRREVFDHLSILNEAHLRAVLAEYAADNFTSPRRRTVPHTRHHILDLNPQYRRLNLREYQSLVENCADSRIYSGPRRLQILPQHAVHFPMLPEDRTAPLRARVNPGQGTLGSRLRGVSSRAEILEQSFTSQNEMRSLLRDCLSD
jgi:hypothetical protein